MVVAHAVPLVPTEEDWRARVLAVVERGARAATPGRSPRSPTGRTRGPARSSCSCPTPTRRSPAARAEGVLRELEASLTGFAFAVGRSRVAPGADDLARAADEALLAANVAEGEGDERRCSGSRRPARTACCCRR